jgi:NinB protein.
MAQYFTIRDERILANCFAAIRGAGPNARVTIAPEQRSGGQNAMFHAICGDLAKSDLTFAGKRRSLEEWKALLVSGHSVATGTGGEVIPGIEGEFVAIRESTSRMSVARASSLIEYALAYCGMNGVQLTETRKGGWLDGPSPSDRAEPRKVA